jgi:hypothetical protein
VDSRALIASQQSPTVSEGAVVLRDADERAREAAQGVAAVVEQLGVALGC